MIYGGQNTPFDRGRLDCIQDANENCPFMSVGGLDVRVSGLLRPSWISEAEWPEYRAGYEEQALRWWGEGWRTVKFGWQRVLTIGGESWYPLGEPRRDGRSA